VHKWGCHSFEGGKIHAIFEMYGGEGFGITTRLNVLWKALTARGIIGVVYSSYYGHSDSMLESSIEKWGIMELYMVKKTW
jgi:hypothetical protein